MFRKKIEKNITCYELDSITDSRTDLHNRDRSIKFILTFESRHFQLIGFDKIPF